MLNITPAVCGGPVAAVAAPDAEAAPGFALALAQASARQCAEATAAGAGQHSSNTAANDNHAGKETSAATGDAAADPMVEARARLARSGGAPRGHGAHGSDPRQAATGPMRGCADAPADVCARPTSATAADAAPAATTDADEVAAAPSQDEAAAPTDLAAWLSSLPLPPPAPPAEAGKTLEALSAARAEAATTTGNAAATSAHAMQMLGEVAARKAGADAAPVPVATPKPATSRTSDTSTAALLPGASADRRAGGMEADARAGTWQQALAAARDPAAATPSDGGVASTTLAVALATSPVASLARAAEGATPLQAEVRAEVGSREFAPALGSQLAVLVRDGIEHARLKLNPAEMGPIEVRISVDGSQAQVDFSAAQAPTRQALQEAVPALAGALREQGLTLTGGGVFEQPRESRGEASTHDGRPSQTTEQRASDDALPAATMPRQPRARGVLDLYA